MMNKIKVFVINMFKIVFNFLMRVVNLIFLVIIIQILLCLCLLFVIFACEFYLRYFKIEPFYIILRGLYSYIIEFNLWFIFFEFYIAYSFFLFLYFNRTKLFGLLSIMYEKFFVIFFYIICFLCLVWMFETELIYLLYPDKVVNHFYDKYYEVLVDAKYGYIFGETLGKDIPWLNRYWSGKRDWMWGGNNIMGRGYLIRAKIHKETLWIYYTGEEWIFKSDISRYIDFVIIKFFKFFEEYYQEVYYDIVGWTHYLHDEVGDWYKGYEKWMGDSVYKMTIISEFLYEDAGEMDNAITLYPLINTVMFFAFFRTIAIMFIVYFFAKLLLRFFVDSEANTGDVFVSYNIVYFFFVLSYAKFFSGLYSYNLLM